MIRYSVADSTNNLRHKPELRTQDISHFILRFMPEAYLVRKVKTSLPVWIPATFTHPSREAAHVQTMTSFVVDCDSLDAQGLAAEVARLKAEGRKFIVHSSHGYAPPEKGKARFIFFLSEEITIGTEWRWRDAIWPALLAHVGLPSSADKSCCDASRAFYLPAKPTADSVTYAEFHDGAPINVQQIIGHILAEPLDKYDFRRPYESREDPTTQVDLGEVAARLRLRYRRDTPFRQRIEQVLNAQTVDEKDGRHVAILKFTIALAAVAKPEECSEDLVQLMWPWLEKMEQRYGRRGNSDSGWRDEAHKALENARAMKPTWDARDARENEKIYESLRQRSTP